MNSVFQFRFLACVLWLGLPCQFVFAQERDVLAMYLFNGTDEVAFKQRLESTTELQMMSVTKVIDLSDEQLDKLRLALRGDLKRFYRQMDAVRETTKDIDLRDQAKMQKAWVAIQPLQQLIADGLLGNDSLYNKVLHATLDDNQHKALSADLEKRKRERYRSVLRMTIADMERILPMTSAQRSKLIELLETSEFPKKAKASNLDAYVGNVMISRVKPDAAQEIFDESQYKVFKQLQANYGALENNFQW